MTQSRKRRSLFGRARTPVAMVAVVALLLAACGGDDADEPAPEEPAAEEPEPQEPEEPEAEEPEPEPEGPDLPDHDYQDGDEIRIIFGSSPGGGLDLGAAVIEGYLADELSELTGLDIRVVREAMPGGGGLVALANAYEAPTDGRLLWWGVLSGAVEQHIVEGEDIDIRDFVPLAQMTISVTGINARGSLEDDLPSWDFQGLEEYSQDQSVLVGVTSAGPRAQAMFGILAEHGIDIDYDVVVYEGGSDLVLGLLREEIDITVNNIATFIEPMEDDPGSIVGFATGVCEGVSPLDPTMPLLVDMGAPQEAHDIICDVLFSSYRGLTGPPGMHEGNAELLRLALANISADPAFQDEFEDVVGFPANYRDADGLATLLDFISNGWEENKHYTEQ